MHRRFQYVGQVQSQTNPGPIERRSWNQDCGEADERLTQHSAALSAQYPPRKGHHGPAWRAMEAKREEVKKLFYDCKGNCSAMHRFVKDTIGVEAPSLRTLQKFCKPFRLELRQSRLTKTGRFETPPGHQMQIDFGEDDVCVGGEGLVHCHACSSSMSRGASCTTKPPRRRDEWLRVADRL